MKKNEVMRESLWSRRSGLFALVVALGVSALGVILDRLLLKVGLPRLDMMIISNSLTGLFAGGLFYQMAREAKASRDLVRERMKTIAELNHHIRNALQVIKFWGVQQRPALDAMQLQFINDSVERIEWALREVLPRYPLDGSSTSVYEPQFKSAGPAA
ncbi:MAG: hypothetical protein WA738_15790 [Candidatus Angelobacter sp.]